MMYTSSIRNKTFKLLLAALFILFHSNSYAISHDELTLNGMSSNWVLNNELYVGALFLESKTSDSDAIMALAGRKRMEFRITTDKWRARNFKKAWARSISINIDDAAQKEYINEIIRFSSMLKGPLLYGDKITIDFTPRKHTRAYINGIQVFYTSKSDFFHALLAAWIGQRPPSSDFKKHILVLSQSDMDVQDAISRYDYIRPDLENQRKIEIQSWVSKKKIDPVAQPTKKATPTPIATPAVLAPKPVTPAPIATPTVSAPKPVTPAPIATPAVSAPNPVTPAPIATPAVSAPNPVVPTPTLLAPKPVATVNTEKPTTITAPTPKVKTTSDSSAFDSLLDEMEAGE